MSSKPKQDFMEGNDMYLLSKNAINQYRKGAKNGADIPAKMLEVKLNC